MTDVLLRYRSFAEVDGLQVGECTIHRAQLEDGRRWWHLWLRVPRDTDLVADTFAVAVKVGAPDPDGPDGHTWGLTRDGDGRWVIAPSINVLGSRVVHPGEHPTESSIWHHEVTISGVSDADTWTTGASP